MDTITKQINLIKNFNLYYQKLDVIIPSQLNDIEGAYSMSFNINNQQLIKQKYSSADFLTSILLINNFLELKQNTNFVFIGVNPRYEASALNVLLTQIKEDNATNMFVFGVADSYYYNYKHEGNSLLDFKNLLEGKKSMLNLINTSKNTKILVNETLYNYLNSDSINNYNKIFYFLYNKLYNYPGFINNSVGSLVNYWKGFLENGNLNIINKNFLKLSNVAINYDSNIKNVSNKFSHISYLPLNMKSNILLGKPTLYEKGGLIFNIEGHVQKINKSISNFLNQNILEKDLFLSQIFYILNKEFKKYRTLFTPLKKNNIYYNILNSRINTINLFYYEKRLNIYSTNDLLFIQNIKFTRQFITQSFFKKLIYNFYTTDEIIKHSKTMLGCSYFQRDFNNFI